MLRKSVLFFILFFSSYIFTTEHKPTLHVLILCDTSSSNIKKASFVDLSNMRRATSLIAKNLHMKKSIRILKGKKMRTGALLHWLKSLSISQKDIVIFYYSGHGFRLESDKTPWPSFLLPGIKSPMSLISGEKICDILRAHSQRFTLVIFDCCNFEAIEKGIGFTPRNQIFNHHTFFPGLQSLFKAHHGMVTIASASPGEFSIAITGGPAKGSIFTSEFLKTLFYKCQKKKPSWKQILERTSDKCSRMTDNTQNPIGYIELHD